MNLEEQVQRHKELSLKIEELEEQKKALGQLILQAMTEKYQHIGNYLVKRFSRLSITTPLEIAQGLRATKMEESVDKEAIKLLYNAGTDVPGVKEISYIQISIK